MARNRQGRQGRKANARNLKERIVIYCEGQTEKQYFDMLSKKYRGITINTKRIGVKTKVMGNTAPIHLVNEAIKNLQSDKKDYQIDQAYVVFDNDDHTPAEITEAIHLATKHQFEVIYSNISFDLWILLHFQPVNNHMTKREIYNRLNVLFQVVSYQNDLKGINLSNYLEDLVVHAYANAQQLISNPNPVIHYINKNPYVNLHQFIKKIFQVDKL